jgi:hypothetical protein
MKYLSSILNVILFALIIMQSVYIIQTEHHLTFWENQTTYYKERYDYYFNGASNRHYLDLCKNNKGVLDVYFKDECVK